MVANVQHPANLLPPSPPVSIEETGGDNSVYSSTTIHTSESESSTIPLELSVSESDEDHMSPFARLAQRQPNESGNEAVYDSNSQTSSHSGLSSMSGSRTPGRYPSSLRSKGMTENTYISAGSSLKSSTVGKKDIDNYSMGYSLGTTSMASSSRSRHKPSRLRNEVPRSPDDNKVHDLFKYTRTRLTDVPHKLPQNSSNSRLTNDDLRRQMLSTIFGWHKEVDDLIQDELSRHPVGSPSRIFLAKWLGDFDADIMAASSENMTSSDWMLLALSGIGGQASQQKLGRAYIQRLLESGDIHAAVTIMLGMGDHNDAIEVYISHKRYMEALILTCLMFPSVWERQSAIIRKWGEWAVQHGEQQLAIRCFACTDKESTEPWTSPSAAQLTFQSITPSIPEILSPPLSPPGVQRGPQRSIAKTSALKLITSFGDQQQKTKFFSQGDGGQTPLAAGPTPIAESAVSPAHDATTAFLRPSSNSRFNTPTTARGNGPSFGRGRLPSIGEVPSDLNKALLKSSQKSAETPESRHYHGRTLSSEQNNMATGSALQRAATASPMMMRAQRAGQGAQGERPPSPDMKVMLKMQEASSNRRNGSRDRIPLGLSLQLQSMEQPETADITSPEQSVSSSTRFHWPTRRRGPGSITSSVTSNSSAGRSLRGNVRQRDDYIHSLEAAQHYSKRQRSRHNSKERARDNSRGRHASLERKARSREASEERGRGAARAFTKPKRSPTSPIPMSPEDLMNLSTPKTMDSIDPITVRKAAGKPPSRNSSRGGRRRSPDARPRPPALDIRGRDDDRSGSLQRSPSSPLPMSAGVHYQGSEDEEDLKKAIQAQENFRAKHSRSATRQLNSPIVSKRERSQSRRRANTETIDSPAPMVYHGRATSTEHAGDLRQMKDDRQRKKEQAARELEERRKSLAIRARTPGIPHPSDFTSPSMRIGIEAADERLPDHLPPRCATEPPKSMYARNGPVIGLPATPKAMRLILEGDPSHRADHERPAVPPVPTTFAQRHSPKSSPEASPEKEKAEPLTLLPSTVYGQGAAPTLPSTVYGQASGPSNLLPSTVYQPPSRPVIPRSMSAPIPDEPSPRHGRHGSRTEMRGIDEVVSSERRRSHEEQIPIPPPPPTAPLPLLRELQHLATPPPPPPAPLPPHVRRSNESPAGQGSAMIEIVMDDDDAIPVATAAPNDGMVPVIPPPAPPASKGHARGRSIGDSSSIAGRFSKATERLRSGSRSSRRETSRMRSPHVEAPYESIPLPLHLKQNGHHHGSTESPYESVPMPTQQMKSPPPPPVMYDQDTVRSPVDVYSKHMSTGLHRSEMI